RCCPSAVSDCFHSHFCRALAARVPVGVLVYFRALPSAFDLPLPVMRQACGPGLGAVARTWRYVAILVPKASFSLPLQGHHPSGFASPRPCVFRPPPAAPPGSGSPATAPITRLGPTGGGAGKAASAPPPCAPSSWPPCPLAPPASAPIAANRCPSRGGPESRAPPAPAAFAGNYLLLW